MKELTSREFHEGIRKALEEVSRKLASGELDGSGRFFTDEELAAGAALGNLSAKEKTPAAPAV